MTLQIFHSQQQLSSKYCVPAWRGSSPSSQSLSTGRRVLDPAQPAASSRPGVLPGAPICAEHARPWLYEVVKCLQRRRKILAWRGHEDIGGEGQLGREPGCPGGDQFFPRLLFVRILLSLSLVKVKFGLAPFVTVQYATACDQGLSAETCNAS